MKKYKKISKTFRKGKFKGFTIIELIVVITILAILGTIGFISFSSHLVKTRDTSRQSQLSSIHEGLEVYSIKEALPIPEKSVEVRANGSLIGYQGYVGKNILGMIEYSKGGKDPKDEIYFTYYVAVDKKNFQLMAYLEDDTNKQLVRNLTNETSATNYTNRYPTVYGKKLGIITDCTINTPIQEIPSIVSSGYLDIVLTTDLYRLNFTDVNYVCGTGTSLYSILADKTGLQTTPSTCYSSGQIFRSKTTYGDCDTADIILCSGNGTGYTLSACNVGTNIAGTGVSSYGNYFQWGRNKGFVIGDTSHQSTKIAGTIGLDAGTDTYGFVWNLTLPAPRSWANTDIANNWGVLEINKTTATWLSSDSTSRTNMQGPCHANYHVPTIAEWISINKAGGWGTTLGTNLMNTLKLPMVGVRNRNDGIMELQGIYGLYWASSPNMFSGYSLGFKSTYINSSETNYLANGFSVRCIKN